MAEELPPVDEWIKGIEIESTAEIRVPKRLIDQVIGQDRAVEIVKKAAFQRRHVLLIGEPGTGKSMMARAMSELLPREELEDILCYYNPEDPLHPKIRVVPAGKGREIVEMEKRREMMRLRERNSFFNTFMMLILFMFIGAMALSFAYNQKINIGDMFLGLMLFLFLMMLMRASPQQMEKPKYPKLLVSHNPGDPAPFIDATGYKAGALLGDVRHDPFQCFSGEEIVVIEEEDGRKIMSIKDFVERKLGENSGEDEVTEGGIKLKVKYSEMKEGSKIFTLGGRTGIRYVNAREGRQKILDLVNFAQDYWISVTPEHKIFLEGGGEKEAQDIRPEDKVMQESVILPYEVPEEFAPIWSTETRLLDLAFVFGALFSSGKVASEKEILFEGDKHVIKEVVGCLENLVENPHYEVIKGEKQKYRLLLKDERACDLLIGMGAEDLEKGSLPSWILIRPRTFVEFLSGVFSAKDLESLRRKYQAERKLGNIKGDANALRSIANALLRLGIAFEIKGGEKAELEIEGSLENLGKLLGILSFSNSFDSWERIFSLVDGKDAEKVKKIAEMISKEKWMKREREVEVTYNVSTESESLVANTVYLRNSGGLETPPNHLVEAGAIHLAHKGVLYIDEIGTLDIETQIKLLTAMQEKKFPITGQSERSFGAMIKTDPVPCDFILVAAGNPETIKGLHPALRSRIRGYGYEVVVNSDMDDTDENRRKLIRFIAQEVLKDGKIPHFDKSAIAEIIKEGQRLAGRKGKLTLRLRELGGLVRVAGDVARSRGHSLVTKEDVLEAKKYFKTLERQMAERYLDYKREYTMIRTEGVAVGRVNGLAVLGSTELPDYAGIVLPIVAEVTPALSKEEGRIIATGKLGEIAKEAVQNVSAIWKRYAGKDLSAVDIHIQFIGTYEGVEGDSASISIATAVISALEGIPVLQSVAMTGSLSVRGEVLPVGGVPAKIEAAIAAGIKKIIVPRANMNDVQVVNIPPDVKIVPVENIIQVLEESLADHPRKKELIERLKGVLDEDV